jgi:hypothetical protein
MQNFITQTDELLDGDTADTLIVKREQVIPQSFMDDLRDRKLNSTNQREGEFMLAMRIPVVIVEELQRRYGFDVLNAPVQETRKMLEKLHFDAFIATRKRI